MKYPYICPVCGNWPSHSFTEKIRWWNPGDFDICSCCGVEYGYETSGAQGPEDPIFKKLREDWVGADYPWCSQKSNSTPEKNRSKNDNFVFHDERYHIKQLENLKILAEMDKAIVDKN